MFRFPAPPAKPQSGGGIAGTHAAATLVTFEALAGAKVVVIFWLLPAAVSDIIIALALTYYLRKHKGRFQSSDKVLDKIIRSTSPFVQICSPRLIRSPPVTVQNGLLTAVTAVVDVIMYFTVVSVCLWVPDALLIKTQTTPYHIGKFLRFHVLAIF